MHLPGLARKQLAGGSALGLGSSSSSSKQLAHPRAGIGFRGRIQQQLAHPRAEKLLLSSSSCHGRHCTRQPNNPPCPLAGV